jgi:hypothetical protein
MWVGGYIDDSLIDRRSSSVVLATAVGVQATVKHPTHSFGSLWVTCVV